MIDLELEMAQFFIGMILIFCGVGVLDSNVPMSLDIFVFCVGSISTGLYLAYRGTESQ